MRAFLRKLKISKKSSSAKKYKKFHLLRWKYYDTRRRRPVHTHKHTPNNSVSWTRHRSRHISRLRSLTVFLSGGGAQPIRAAFDLVSGGEKPRVPVGRWMNTTTRTRSRRRRSIRRRSRRNRSQRATWSRRGEGGGRGEKKNTHNRNTIYSRHVIAFRSRR